MTGLTRTVLASCQTNQIRKPRVIQFERLDGILLVKAMRKVQDPRLPRQKRELVWHIARTYLLPMQRRRELRTGRMHEEIPHSLDCRLVRRKRKPSALDHFFDGQAAPRD